MSNEPKKPQPSQPEAFPTDRWVQVKKMSFQPPSIDVPGKEDCMGLHVQSPEQTHNRHELAYHSGLRVFRIAYRRAPEHAAAVGYVPEHKVSYWEPS